MSFVVTFVGLINFYDRGRQGKLLLLPNGTVGPLPGTDIPLHFAGIFALRDQVRDFSWAGLEEDTPLPGVQHFPILNPSTIQISGIEPGSGRVDPSRQDGFIPVLQTIVHNFNAQNGIAGDFTIDPEHADTIAKIPVGQGILEAFIFGRDSIVSRLTVPGSDLVQITADDGQEVKTLTLRKGSEIVISNLSKPAVVAPIAEATAQDPMRSHFRIYAKLDVNRRPDGLIEPAPPPSLEQLASAHPYLALLRANEGSFPTPGCSVTG